jgi:hypothetical protein
MFAIVFLVSFVMFILGSSELRTGLLNWKKDAASPAMGFVYFIISTITFFVIALWWSAMATDSALGTLGFFWSAMALTAASMAIACVCLIVLSTVGNKQNDDGGRLEVREETFG